jgi:hypothetical protein
MDTEEQTRAKDGFVTVLLGAGDVREMSCTLRECQVHSVSHMFASGKEASTVCQN